MEIMKAPYWIEDYLIDPDRNQVTRSQKVSTLQPKVLAVLHLLAENVGKVVSHDELMQRVWPDTYVGPNTLQRCIAELRKTLGDDSKTQAIIKTHSKRGYSLEAQVKLASSSSTKQSEVQHDISGPSTFSAKKFIVLVLALLVTVIFYAAWKPDDSKVFTHITPLTATDAKEYYPDYSPDGRYMVFHRYVGVCENHIWAKDLETKEEHRLTLDSAIYGPHSWSSDGTQLAFTKQQNCSQDTVQKAICWELHTLDFASSLQQPHPTTERLDCKSQRISKPKWLTDGRILMLEHSEKNSLVSFQSTTNELAPFFLSLENNIVHFDIAPSHSEVAVFSQDKMLEMDMVLLDRDGTVFSKTPLNLPDTLSIFQRFEPNYDPTGKSFVLNSPQGLFMMTKDEFKQVIYEGPSRLFTPRFNAAGDAIVATVGSVDADIGLLKLTDMQQTKTIARSNNYDADGKFQPNGNSVAFLSQRSGNSQVWIVNEQQIKQLSNFPKGTHVSNPVWSPAGDRIVTVVNDSLVILNLDGDSEQLELPYLVDSVFQWFDSSKLLIEANIDAIRQIAIVDINTLALEKFEVFDPIFAHYHASLGLFYVDQKRVARIQNGKSTIVIERLKGQLDSKRFLADNGNIYGVNWRDELWRYNVATDTLKIVRDMPNSYWWVSDVKDELALITSIISSPQEIIELRHSE